MMRRLPLLLALAPLLPAQEPAEALARFRLLGLGDYQIEKQGAEPANPDDIALAARYLDSDDPQLRGRAALALYALMRYPFYGAFDAQEKDRIHGRLIALFADEGKHVAEWSKRAVREGARRKHLTPRQVRTAASQSLGIVLRDDPDARRHAALLLSDLTPSLPPQFHPEAGRTLLLALERYKKVVNDAERTAHTTVLGVLSHLDLGTGPLGEEVAGRMLADLAADPTPFGFFYDRKKALRCLARHLGALEGPRRTAAVEHVMAGLSDRDLLYMLTSGRRTPFLHAGAEALIEAWPHLSTAEQTRARELVAALRKTWSQSTRFTEGDLASIFGGVVKFLELDGG